MACRFGLVRVRENAESIAFYGGEDSEAKLLFQRLGKVVANYGDLLVTSRNLSFFTSFYRYDCRASFLSECLETCLLSENQSHSQENKLVKKIADEVLA